MALLEMINNLLRKLWNTAFVLVQDFAVHSLVSRVNERYTYNYKLRRSFLRHLKRNKKTTSSTWAMLSIPWYIPEHRTRFGWDTFDS
jgi:hypothetical protein